jgi:hypothetical protein
MPNYTAMLGEGMEQRRLRISRWSCGCAVIRSRRFAVIGQRAESKQTEVGVQRTKAAGRFKATRRYGDTETRREITSLSLGRFDEWAISLIDSD